MVGLILPATWPIIYLNSNDLCLSAYSPLKVKISKGISFWVLKIFSKKTEFSLLYVFRYVCWPEYLPISWAICLASNRLESVAGSSKFIRIPYCSKSAKSLSFLWNLVCVWLSIDNHIKSVDWYHLKHEYSASVSGHLHVWAVILNTWLLLALHKY